MGWEKHDPFAICLYAASETSELILYIGAVELLPLCAEVDNIVQWSKAQ